MVLKTVNAVLLLTALVGVYFAIRAGSQMRQLRAEYGLLAAEVGSLDVQPVNDDKLHLVAIKTDDPLDFAWQIYVPGGFNLRWTERVGSGSSGSSGSTTTDPYFDLVRVRLRQQSDGGWQIWMKHRSGSSRFGVSPREAKLLQRRDLLTIEQIGTGGAVILDGQQVGTMLRLSPRDAGDSEPLLEIRIGSQQAFEKLDATTPTQPAAPPRGSK
jgi:hypothetical protein